MLINNCSSKLNKIYIDLWKVKINNLFLFFKFIIFINVKVNDLSYLKTIFLKYNISSLILKKKDIKDIFSIPSFLFLKGGQYICGFVNDETTFLSIIKAFENKKIFYSYKKNLNNIITCTDILDIYNKYNNNYIYIQFILEQIKIKVIILLFLFLITFTQYMK